MIRGSIFAMPATDQDQFQLNRLTLAFSGKIKQYERAFRDDYFQQSIVSMRLALFLSFILFGIFAFLDALVLPELKFYFGLLGLGSFLPY